MELRPLPRLNAFSTPQPLGLLDLDSARLTLTSGPGTAPPDQSPVCAPMAVCGESREGISCPVCTCA